VEPPGLELYLLASRLQPDMQQGSARSQFSAKCALANDYPHTLLRSPRPHEVHSRSRHADILQAEAKDLFDPTEAKVDFWETGADNSEWA
jgi:hypothetical protein